MTVDERRAERRDQRDGEQDVGKRHHGVDDARERRVEPAEEAGDKAERHAEDGRERDDADAPTSSDSRPA